VIKDLATLSEIGTEWHGVQKLVQRLKVDAMTAFATTPLGGYYPFFLAKAAQNLPLVHACSVLNHVLIALESEGHFVCKRTFLGALMESSKKALPWVNFSRIKQVVKDRNGIAHSGKLLEQELCWKYVDAIQVELVSWGIVK
jgi:hypothetical protein